MNWDRVEGNWRQFKGKVKEKWGRLTDDQLTTIAGRRDRLAGQLQETYGCTKEDAERQIRDWERSELDFDEKTQEKAARKHAN